MENNKKNSNVIAIVGFILSFFIGLAGLICSIIGLIKSKELNSGKAFSIAGIIISSLRIALTLLLTVFIMLIVIDESKNAIDYNKGKIIDHIQEKTKEEKAYDIISEKWGSSHNYSNETYTYVYMGTYKDANSKEYYVFDIKWLVENHHYSSIGYYAVSLNDNDYYFINNSPEFLETGIIYVETKVYNYD